MKGLIDDGPTYNFHIGSCLVENPLGRYQTFEPKWVLRWRMRKCNHCGNDFNISQEVYITAATNVYQREINEDYY